MNYGYVRLSRKLFDGSDPLWSRARKFSSAEAWIDLVQRAAWHEVAYSTARGVDRLRRGEFVGSLRFHAEHWRWSKGAVERFLTWCEKAGRIMGQRVGRHGAVYLIVNYDRYQSHNILAGTPDGTPNGPLVGHPWDKDEEGKARKAVVQDGASALSTRRDEYPLDFEQAWAAYPPRLGSNPKRPAYRAWLARQHEGYSAEDMHAGVERYAAYVTATGKAGTEFVMQAKRLFGPALEWTHTWAAEPDGARILNGSAPDRSADWLAAAMDADAARLRSGQCAAGVGA